MTARHGSDEPAARLIERVLSDSAFRARFRRDPEGAARELGLDVSDTPPIDPALQTLELRESKSSLAGALMAAAAEGVGLYELIHHAGGAGLGVEDAVAAVPHASDEALALLDNRHIQFDATGIADIRSGRVDPRVVDVLDAVAKHHRITVSSLISDHPKNTANGSVSNHYYGRAVDIATVDGRPVSSDNASAHALAEELLRLDPSIRPTELGSPWALGDPVAFTDADHQDHIHVAFDDPIQPGRAPPAVTPDDVTDPDDTPEADPPDTDAPDDDTPDSDPPDSDAPDEPAASDDTDDDEEDSDEEDAGDSDGEDEDEPDEDEDEPDEDEVGPDQDDLTDDEVTGNSSDDGSDSGDSSDDGSDSGDSSDDGSDSGESSDDGSDSNDSSDSANSSDDGGAEPDLDGVDAAYPGDNAPSSHIAAWMGAEAKRRRLPPELPVMASLVESGMHNLPGGDRDSVGFFQMRTSIWNSGAYVRYADRPKLQLDWFLDHAEAVKHQRVAAGLPVDDPKHYGDWIADVERPAAQYRGRYQLRLDEARELLRRGAHSPSGADLVDNAGGGAALAAGPRAAKAVAEAQRYLGTPYRWGGSSPSTGFDCSGLVQWAFAKAGIHLPRTSEEQILAPGGKNVDRKHLLPGDLVFFRDSTGDVHHVGISLGGKKFIEAPHTGSDVRISSLDEPYYAQQFTGARRFDAAVSGDGNEARVLAVIRPDQVRRRGR